MARIRWKSWAILQRRRWRRRATAFAEFAVDVVHDRRDDVGADVLAGFLRVLSEIFRLLAQARVALYRWRILRDHHLGCLVIVVGNLTVGGTGKTPVVERLAGTLARHGRRVAILSRGYGSAAEAEPRAAAGAAHDPRAFLPTRLVSDGATLHYDSEGAGDEPFMLARNLRADGVAVLVDRDRVRAGSMAIRRLGVDTLILDDGFQYLRLKNHLHLLLIDKTNPFGNGHLLPRGILREPVRHLRRATSVLLTKSDGKPDPELEELVREHKPDAEIMECTHRPQYLQSLPGGARRPLADLAGRRVAAFCGIAAPESFLRFLRDHGAELVHERAFLDHHRFRGDELAQLGASAVAAGAEWIVTTEKDAVRLPDDPGLPLPIFFLRVEIELIAGARDWDALVRRIVRAGGNGSPVAAVGGE